MKPTLYFSHDAKARRHTNLQALQLIYGIEGYGRFWILMEILREQPNYKYQLKTKFAYPVLAKELATTPEKVKEFISSCINDFSLFKTDGRYFWNDTLIETMDLMEAKSKRAREAVKKRWAKSKEQAGKKEMNTDVLQMNNKEHTNVLERKEIKKNKIKLNKRKRDEREKNYFSLPSFLTSFFYKWGKKRNPAFKEPDFVVWRQEFVNLLAQPFAKPTDVSLALYWMKENDFFRKLITSPILLSKHWDKVMNEFELFELEDVDKDELLKSYFKDDQDFFYEVLEFSYAINSMVEYTPSIRDKYIDASYRVDCFPYENEMYEIEINDDQSPNDSLQQSENRFKITTKILTFDPSRIN